MKKIALTLTLILTTMTASAEPWYHGHDRYVYRPGIGWVLPALVGGAIVYETTRPTQPNVVVVQPATPVVVQPATPVVVPPASPAGYHWEAILDVNCNCYRTVLVAN